MTQGFGLEGGKRGGEGSPAPAPSHPSLALLLQRPAPLPSLSALPSLPALPALNVLSPTDLIKQDGEGLVGAHDQREQPRLRGVARVGDVLEVVLRHDVRDRVLVAQDKVHLPQHTARRVGPPCVRPLGCGASVCTRASTGRRPTLPTVPHLSGPNMIVYGVLSLSDSGAKSADAEISLTYAPPQLMASWVRTSYLMPEGGERSSREGKQERD